MESADYRVAKENVTEKLTPRLPLTIIKPVEDYRGDTIQLTKVVKCAQLLMKIEEYEPISSADRYMRKLRDFSMN